MEYNTLESLGILIYETCKDRTKTVRQCCDDILSASSLTVDIYDFIYKYRQSGSGLEKITKAILEEQKKKGITRLDDDMWNLM